MRPGLPIPLRQPPYLLGAAVANRAAGPRDSNAAAAVGEQDLRQVDAGEDAESEFFLQESAERGVVLRGCIVLDELRPANLKQGTWGQMGECPHAWVYVCVDCGHQGGKWDG